MDYHLELHIAKTSYSYNRFFTQERQRTNMYLKENE